MQNVYLNVIMTIINFIITQGEKCDKCDTTTHIYCLKDYTKTHSGLGCPNCHYSVSEPDNSNNTNNSTMDLDTDIEMAEPAKSNQERKLRRKCKD
ncbi:hypothetical protein X777_14581 [Ooceraea biroi]|uniref:Non-structural maintenance of chromosomes element 1 RING C4HC3-type domain-containing protein n=1 Tax=Ooceraea biroi TaxID=2015173 RepID=A0A026WWV2_OOCBI|nr:hypothetical protein X777_14581 [Ooceraea biroi]